MYSSFTKSTIKNQNTQLTEKSVGITIRMFPDYPIEKSQYPINKKISGYYPIHQNFLSGALYPFSTNITPSVILTHKKQLNQRHEIQNNQPAAIFTQGTTS